MCEGQLAAVAAIKERTLIGLNPFKWKFFKMDVADFRLEMQLLYCVIRPIRDHRKKTKWDEAELKLLKELQTVVLCFFYMAVNAFFFI